MFAGVAGKVEKFIYDILYCFEFLVQVATKSILLLTCRSCPHSDPKLDAQARRKAMDLHNTDICLDVVPVCGPQEAFHLERFYAGLIKLAEDEASLGVLPLEELSDSVLKKTTTKKSNGRLKLNLGGTIIAVSSFNLTRKMNKPSKQRMTADTNEEVVSGAMKKKRAVPPSPLKENSLKIFFYCFPLLDCIADQHVILIGEIIATLLSSKHWCTITAFRHEQLRQIRRS